MTIYVPCVGEICAVQFSCDMVSRGLLKQVLRLLFVIFTLAVFWLGPPFCVCVSRTGTEALYRLWLLTIRWLTSFTLTLAMKKMSLWIGSEPWRLTSSLFAHVWVHICTVNTFSVTSWHFKFGPWLFYLQAMECRITGVVPVAGSWSGECCIAVRQLLAGKIVTVRLVETVEDGRIHAVDILLSMGELYKTEMHI